MGCCGISNGELNQDLEIVRINAKEYALENKITVAIYKEGKEYKFCEYDCAITEGLTVIQVVSKHH